MKDKTAVTILSALAQEHRLRIFRMLVKVGPSGMASTEIAESVGIGPTGASFHLKELEQAGLLIATRQGRFIRYSVHIDAMRRFLTYLTEDCCQGQPELCGSTFKRIRSVCSPKEKCK